MIPTDRKIASNIEQCDWRIQHHGPVALQVEVSFSMELHCLGQGRIPLDGREYRIELLRRELSIYVLG
jgi:hypothetical protein